MSLPVHAATPPALDPPFDPPRRPWGIAWRVVGVRLRFFLILGVATLVVAEWEVARNYWGRLVRVSQNEDPATRAISSETEYFCPMDPGVVSDWPGKCGVCNMALVRRKRGDVAPLPGGVISRMQFSPYRLQLGGVQVSAVGYRPLATDLEAVGTVRLVPRGGISRTIVNLDVTPDEIGVLRDGQAAEVWSADGRGTQRISGVVRTGTADNGESPTTTGYRVEIEVPSAELRDGVRVIMRIPASLSLQEPFRSFPALPSLQPGEPRTVFECAEHPRVIREAPGQCPLDQTALERRDLTGNQRVRWWCPMHAEVTASVPGRTCESCGGMQLVQRVVSFNPPGQFLAIPESAVIDTGTKSVVYVERMPGMFDGVEVKLGPRCGAFYPVISGLEPGQRVVTTGSFLIDSETRLNPSLAASYFGAGAAAGRGGRDPGATSDSDAPLSAQDRVLVDRQKVCPVTGKRLGSMGQPLRLEFRGRPVFLCCDACQEKFQRDPAGYLAKLPPDSPGNPHDTKSHP